MLRHPCLPGGLGAHRISPNVGGSLRRARCAVSHAMTDSDRTYLTSATSSRRHADLDDGLSSVYCNSPPVKEFADLLPAIYRGAIVRFSKNIAECRTTRFARAIGVLNMMASWVKRNCTAPMCRS